MSSRFKSILMTAALSLLFVFPVLASAKAGIRQQDPVLMKSGKVYSKYDVTGDGTADKIKVEYVSAGDSESGKPECLFTLGDEELNAVEVAGTGSVYLLAPREDLVLFVIYSNLSDSNTGEIYRYQDEEIVKAYDYQIGGSALDFSEPYKVGMTKFYASMSVGDRQMKVFDPDDSIPTMFRVSYRIKPNGKVALESRLCPALGNKKFVSLLPFTTSSGANANNKKGAKVKAGQAVNIVSMYIRKGNIPVFQIKIKGGKTGWIVPKTSAKYAPDEFLLTHR